MHPGDARRRFLSYRNRVSVPETVLTFVVAPAAVILLIAGLVYAGGTRQNNKRYRPGRPFDFAPVWFLSAPEQLANGDGPALEGRHALPASSTVVDGAQTGGASDRW